MLKNTNSEMVVKIINKFEHKTISPWVTELSGRELKQENGESGTN